MGNRHGTCRLGHSHRSQLEISVCAMIGKRKDIRLLQVEDHIYLTRARILYIPDFRCEDVETLEPIWIEAKGFEAPTWRIKRRLWKSYGPGPLLVYKGSAARPILHETLIPSGETANDSD